jgi:ABC-2 type transport system permease protein
VLRIVAAFLIRDFRINLSYRSSFVLQTVATLFQLALFFFLGRVINHGIFADQNLSGGYFGYAVVGLLVLSMVQVSVGSFSLKLHDEQTTGTFEALMTSPTSPSLIVLSSAAYELIRAIVSASILIVVAVTVFGLRFELGPGSAAVAALALFGCLGLFASFGIAVAAATVVVKRTIGLLGLMFAAIALLSGVYYPITVLPDPIEWVAKALPLTWGLDALRASLLGGEVNPAQLAGLFASAALLLPVALYGFALAVRRARRNGTLAQY